MRSTALGKRLQELLAEYEDYIADYYIEEDGFGAEYDIRNKFSVWIHMEPQYTHPEDGSTVIHEYDQRQAVRKLKEIISHYNLGK